MASGWSRLVWVTAIAASMAGCSLFNTEEELFVMAPLPKIEARIQPQIAWQQQVGEGIGDDYSALAPVLDNGKLFAADRQGIVQARDPDSGELLWQKDLGEGDSAGHAGNNARLSGGVTAAYDRLFIGSENATLYCLDQNTGEVLWEVATAGEILSRPATDSAMVLVVSASGSVEAFSALDGKLRWRTDFELPNLTLRGTSEPVASNGGLLFGRADGRLAVVLEDNGQIAWEQRIAQPSGATEIDRIVDVDSRPVVIGSTVYVIAYNGQLMALDLRSGAVQWKRDYSSYQNLGSAGLSLYISDSRGHLFAVDRQTGTELWEQPGLEYRGLTAPAVVGEYLVVGDQEGYLHWLDRDSGNFVGQQRLDDEGLYGQPLVTDSQLYIQGRSGKLVAIHRP